ncbi:hypothetical protein Tco_0379304 [Tanacetum coccineum]
MSAKGEQFREDVCSLAELGAFWTGLAPTLALGGGGTLGGGDIDEDVARWDGSFKGALGALGDILGIYGERSLEMEALVDAMEVYGG